MFAPQSHGSLHAPSTRWRAGGQAYHSSGGARTGRGLSLQAVLRPGALLASLALAGCMSVPVPDLPDRTPSTWTQVPQGQGVALDAKQWWKV